MRQEQVTAIMDSYIVTTSGVKKPIGDHAFMVGDYAWVHGMAAYGHETGGGFAPVEVGGIPVLTPLLAGNTFHYEYGLVPSASYQVKGDYTTNEHDYDWEPFYHRFVYDKTHAYLLAANTVSGQYDLLSQAQISNVFTYEIFDACVSLADEDGVTNVLYVADCVDGGSGYSMLNYDPWGWWTTNGTIIQRNHADWRIYRDGTEVASLGALIDEIAAIKEGEYPFADVASLTYIEQNTVIHHRSVIRPDGSYIVSGYGLINVWQCLGALRDVQRMTDQRRDMKAYGYYWSIENGVATVGESFLLQRIVQYYDPDDVLHEHLKGITTKYDCPQHRFELNDGFYYLADGVAGNSRLWAIKETATVYDPSGVPVVTLSDYENRLVCVTAAAGGYLLNAHNGAGYPAVVLVKTVDGVQTITPLKMGRAINARLVKTNLSNKYQSGLAEVFKLYFGGA